MLILQNDPVALKGIFLDTNTYWQTTFIMEPTVKSWKTCIETKSNLTEKVVDGKSM